MSIQAPNWFVTQYNDRAQAAFQAKGWRLKPTVTTEARIEGQTAKFPIYGPGVATKMVRGQTAVPMNVDKKWVDAFLQTWQAFDFIEEYDLDRMTINERQVVADSGGKALGRAADQEIIDLMNAAVATSGTTNYYANTSTAFGAVDAMNMVSMLQENLFAEWDGQVYCGLPALLWNQLLSYKVVNNADYVGSDLPFVKATDTRFWNGVNWFLFPKQFFPVPAANQIDVFMWYKPAIGWCPHDEMITNVAWENKETRWSVNMRNKGAGVVLQPSGIIRGRFLTNTALTIN